MNKLVFYHPRLWISVAAGCVIFFFLPERWSTLSRVLVCWNCGVALFLTLIFYWMTRLTAEQICSRYIEEDDSAPVILAVVTIAAALSLVAIIEPLATMKQVTGTERIGHFALAALTLLNSWILVPTMFTTHYADMFYSANEEERPLRFPETPKPVFWDFAYFSFTIAAACQTADVATMNAAVRRTVIAHTMISFLFNASILGFAINVTAGLIGGN
ncbi:MAG TPA: DUF1345 domain-containing protein [Steroidobacteraceae bacterium]|jgi:uncharacterized membrane protein|nr:DUF1345 domain-containing protein [Steroidobacteraceae bacterium]